MDQVWENKLPKISLSEFRLKLQSRRLLPGWRQLLEQIEERFAALERAGFHDVPALMDGLNTKPRLAKIARSTGIPEDYLTLLRREANSVLPKPVPLSIFPDVDASIAEKLRHAEITTTKHMLTRGYSPEGRQELAAATGLTLAEIEQLVQLADVSRVPGIGPVGARLLNKSGVHSVADFASCDAVALNRQMNAVNNVHHYTKIMASDKDLDWCIQIAKTIRIVVQW